MNHPEVKISKFSFTLTILLGIIFVPLILYNFINGLLDGLKVVSLGLGLMMLITFVAILLMLHRGHSNSVKYFFDEGLIRNDGRRFVWIDLSCVINQFRITSIAHGTKSLWRTEIQFKNGESAWLIPTRISNFTEVSDFVNNLPCQHTEVRV